MKSIFRSLFLLLSLLFLIPSLSAITIKEKKEGLSHGGSDLDPQSRELLQKVNAELLDKQAQLKQLYAQVARLYAQNSPDSSYQSLLQQINALKDQMDALDNRWRDGIVKSNQGDDYGLWYQPDTTVEQLVIDYGSQDYVYVIPNDVALMKLSVASNLPIPRSSWSEMLDLILSHNGVGIQQINPYLRKLYLLAQNQSAVKVVTNRRQDLDLFPVNSRICFVLSPEAAEVRRIWFFLDKFVDHQNTILQLIGREILLIGSVSEVQDLLKLYDFAANNKGDKDYKLVSLAKIQSEEMAKILGAIFDHAFVGHQNTMHAPNDGPAELTQAESNGLKVIVLDNLVQALFLIGTREEINKAEEVIREVDDQLGDAREKVIYWYTAKNSDAEELAEVLSKIYLLMVQERVGMAERNAPNGFPFMPGAPMPPFGAPPPGSSPAAGAPVAEVVPLRTQDKLYSESFYQDGNIVVNPAPVTLGTPPKDFTRDDRHNFIVDVKTNAIVMVVEADILPKMKDLLRKLDVPKKMVQIEVLLFEKKISDATNYGLNLLRLGSAASQTHKTSFVFNDLLPFGGVFDPLARGITTFMLSRPKTDDFPAFDFVYRFLLTQDDVTINACPSVTTMNQTPAKIAIVEEISINTGIYDVETAKGNTLKDAFTRAQYGITLEITPTIFMHDAMDDDDDDDVFCSDGINYISLSTSVNFDSFNPNTLNQGRPDVTRRNIENEVLIPDGQTVILGGLRRKNSHETNEAIPFLGELPGIGKLFSHTHLEENSTEMFIFITPKIIYDPTEDLDRMRCEELGLRPGDIPEFLDNLVEAREMEKNRLLAGTMRILWGPPEERVYGPCGEYDGR